MWTVVSMSHSVLNINQDSSHVTGRALVGPGGGCARVVGGPGTATGTGTETERQRLEEAETHTQLQTRTLALTVLSCFLVYGLFHVGAYCFESYFGFWFILGC